MARWTITEWDGSDVRSRYELPGFYSEAEVQTVLQRLVCRTLSVVEIIDASRRTNDPERNSFLDPVSERSPMDHGEGLHFTAEYET